MMGRRPQSFTGQPTALLGNRAAVYTGHVAQASRAHVLRGSGLYSLMSLSLVVSLVVSLVLSHSRTQWLSHTLPLSHSLSLSSLLVISRYLLLPRPPFHSFSLIRSSSARSHSLSLPLYALSFSSLLIASLTHCDVSLTRSFVLRPSHAMAPSLTLYLCLSHLCWRSLFHSLPLSLTFSLVLSLTYCLSLRLVISLTRGASLTRTLSRSSLSMFCLSLPYSLSPSLTLLSMVLSLTPPLAHLLLSLSLSRHLSRTLSRSPAPHAVSHTMAGALSHSSSRTLLSSLCCLSSSLALVVSLTHSLHSPPPRAMWLSLTLPRSHSLSLSLS